jgi:hypothetical protein
VARLDGVEVLGRGKVVLEEQQHARGNGRERVVCCDAVRKKPSRRAMAVEDTAPEPTDVAWRRLFRATGIAGLAATVLIFAAVLAGTRTEPTFNATATEVLADYRSPNTPGPISGLSS